MPIPRKKYEKYESHQYVGQAIPVYIMYRHNDTYVPAFNMRAILGCSISGMGYNLNADPCL